MAGKTATDMRSVSEWIALVNDPGSGFHTRMNEIHGGDGDLASDGGAKCLATLEAFGRGYGLDRKVIVARAAGRVNMMGTHVDHRGGSVNPVAVKGLWLVVEPRDDDRVLVRNVESDQHQDEEFSISECLPSGKIEDWDHWCHDELEKRKNDPAITWSNYIRAIVLYLQHIHTEADGKFNPALKGMNMMFYGDIPGAAGLSSSSALVVSTSEAVLHLNELQVDPLEQIQQCGFAEWYVGTRGGCGDHAAIRLGQPNMILHMTAFPMEVSSARLSPEYRLVLANSMVEAAKREGARNIFNDHVASYNFAKMMLCKSFPEHADKIEHLRDVNPTTLGVDEAEIYRLLKSLPASANRDDIVALLPEKEAEIRGIFRSHDEPAEGYQIRQICLYGVAECIRANMVPELLAAGDMTGFGELMNASHDGDRVTELIDGERVPVDDSYPDSKIDALIGDLESGDPKRMEQARLWRQGGGYDVSVPEMDMLVDIALAAPGVVGAGLVGAGMGGSVVAVVRKEHAQEVIDAMEEQYYQPRGLALEAEIVKAVEGAGVLSI